MSKPSIYLAGAVSGLTYNEATTWREDVRVALDRYGIQTISPMRGSDHLLEVVSLKDSHDEHTLSSQRAIMDRCEFDVHRADSVLVNLLEASRPSFGTVMEIAWAYRARKPVILVMEADNLHEHAMIRQAATYRVFTLDEAINISVVLLRK